MEEEIFKPIKGFEGLYEVSNFGRIKSLISCIYLKSFNSGDSYRSVGLRKEGVKHTTLVHTLVGKHFISNPNNLPELNHLDFDRANNRADNLEWVTHGDNIRYSYINGNRIGAKGEDNPKAKHTNESVLKIRELYKTGNYTQNELASMFNDKRNNIAKIILRERWSHI